MRRELAMLHLIIFPITLRCKIIKFIKEYEECINELYKELPLPIYNKIVATGIKGKLNKLTVYAKK